MTYILRNDFPLRNSKTQTVLFYVEKTYVVIMPIIYCLLFNLHNYLTSQLNFQEVSKYISVCKHIDD